MNAKKSDLTRRKFVTTTSSVGAGAAALGAGFVSASAFGANDRLRLGIVGTGARGNVLMSWAHRLQASHNVQFTAVCDIWNRRREDAAGKIGKWNEKAVACYRRLDDLCARDDTDVVIIATADFQHCYQAAKAVQAGKDVYVEKPFGCDFEQIKQAYLSIKASSRIVQMGTQSRGEGKYFGARDYIKSGALGKITYGEISECLFQPPGKCEEVGDHITREEIDWEEFLAYLDPARYEWNPRHYREFRLFWPFSSGCFCQRMSHRIDLVNLALDAAPNYATAMGGVYLWKDGRTNPDTVQCLLEYPDGVLISYHLRMGNSANGRGIYLYGTNGTLDLNQGLALSNGGGGEVSWIDAGKGGLACTIDKRKIVKDHFTIPSPPSVDHLGNFFECVRRREQPRADIEAGYAHALAITMAHLAYRTGCRMEYDPVKMEIRPSLTG
ncbi:MAG: gfo/Idh/MocA family oxidoreductase [Candidatus Omnitrophota bacterium]|jgi:predicted dehydrogenase|nr:MAG: gfo/Idh/MocA family oxidoreductase [Candidatus Omnitrophota bacterium]